MLESYCSSSWEGANGYKFVHSQHSSACHRTTVNFRFSEGGIHGHRSGQSTIASALLLNAIFIVFSRARAILGVKPIIRRRRNVNVRGWKAHAWIMFTVKDLQYTYISSADAGCGSIMYFFKCICTSGCSACRATASWVSTIQSSWRRRRWLTATTPSPTTWRRTSASPRAPTSSLASNSGTRYETNFLKQFWRVCHLTLGKFCISWFF